MQSPILKIPFTIILRCGLKSLLFTSILFPLNLRLAGQCVATTTNSPATMSDDNSTGTLSFSSVNNAKVPDNNMASAAAIAFLFTGHSHYLMATNFGFNIPSGASICGVVVEIEKMAGGIGIGAWIRDYEVKLVKAGSVIGNNLGNTATDWGTTNAYTTYGNATNLWGTTLTESDVNASNFGMVISARYNGVALLLPSAQVDHIRMTVYYNPSLPTHIISFNSSSKNNTARLEWTTADEADDELVILQRSVSGQSSWTDISSYQMHTGNTRKKYVYEDFLNETGNYSYRLKINMPSGDAYYSEIKTINYQGKETIDLYPNPGHDFINLSNIPDNRSIRIMNTCLQEIKLRIERIGTHSYCLNVQNLSRGMYFIATGSGCIRFIKE